MTKLFCSLLICISFNSHSQQHSHEKTPSTARQDWGNFEAGQLIKLKEVNWLHTPIGQKITKKGKLKPEYSYVDSLSIYHMVYDSDGLMVTGFMVRPKRSGKYPAIIYNRGGNRDHGELLVSNAVTDMGSIAREGYVVIASNYRGNSNSEGQEEFGGKDIRDVINLVPALGQISVADTSRLGMIGVSRGGMMGYLYLKHKCNLKALVVIGGLSNLNTFKSDRPDMESHVFAELIPNYADSTDFKLKARSATFWADKLCSNTKILILHGEKDKAVSVQQARELHENLEKEGVEHTYKEFAKGNHGLSSYREEVHSLISDWFSKHVRGAKG